MRREITSKAYPDLLYRLEMLYKMLWITGGSETDLSRFAYSAKIDEDGVSQNPFKGRISWGGMLVQADIPIDVSHLTILKEG